MIFLGIVTIVAGVDIVLRGYMGLSLMFIQKRKASSCICTIYY